MKAEVRKTNEIVEVYHTGTCVDTRRGEVWIYETFDGSKRYKDYELCFMLPIEHLSDSDLRISVAKLREVLTKYGSEKNLMSDDFDVDEIIEKVKSEI